MNKRNLFAIIGAILGIPLSWFFQAGMAEIYFDSFGEYLLNFIEVFEDTEFIIRVIFSVIFFAVIGGVIGHFIDAKN